MINRSFLTLNIYKASSRIRAMRIHSNTSIKNNYNKRSYFKPNIQQTQFFSSTFDGFKKKLSDSKVKLLIGGGGALILGFFAYSQDVSLYFKETDKTPVYTADDVAKHDSLEKRIWVSYGSNVYDITDFVSVHPGGEMIFLAAGKALEPFWETFANHKTEQVYEILDGMKIGKLAVQKKAVASVDPYAMDPKRSDKFIVHSSKPFNAETPLKLLAENFITPNEIFYVRNHLPVPLVNPREHKLEISGLGMPDGQSIKVSMDDLKNDFPKRTITTTISCAGNRRLGLHKVQEVKGIAWDAGAISTSEWSGVYLLDVLKHFKVDVTHPDIKHVHFEGLDTQIDNSTYSASVPSSKVLDPLAEVMLAYEMNGQEIPLDHGFPLRVVVPGVTGARNVKWLRKVVLSDKENQGHWQQKDYKMFSSSTTWEKADFSTAPAIQEMPVNSAICDPGDGATLKVDDGRIKLKGYAWSGGGRPIDRVDVSIDGGESWQQASLSPESRDKKWAWTLWEISVPVETEKEKLRLVCKAVDSSNNVQPDGEKAVWNIRGLLNNAWHKIDVTIEH